MAPAWIGHGDKCGPQAPSSDALMIDTVSSTAPRIGEGEKARIRALQRRGVGNGEGPGSRGGDRPTDPQPQPRGGRDRDRSPRHMSSPSGRYMERSRGRGSGRRDRHTASPETTSGWSPRPGRSAEEVTSPSSPGPPRGPHRRHPQCRRSVYLISDGDVAGAIAAAPPWASTCMGIGGTPEGVIAQPRSQLGGAPGEPSTPRPR